MAAKRMGGEKQGEAVVRVMVSPSEKAELQKAASRVSLPISVYVRSRALSAARAEVQRGGDL
jgi:hypothetical protein